MLATDISKGINYLMGCTPGPTTTKCNTREQYHAPFYTLRLLQPDQVCGHDSPFHGCNEEDSVVSES